jgi:hypothetical protein
MVLIEVITLIFALHVLCQSFAGQAVYEKNKKKSSSAFGHSNT